MVNPAVIMGVVKSPVFKYISIAVVTLGVVYVIYSAGQNQVQTKWDLANEKTKVQIAELTAKSKIVTTVVEVRYVDKVKTVTIKGDKIITYVDRYITPAADAKCVIPNNFILLHDSAVNNTVPDEEKAK